MGFFSVRHVAALVAAVAAVTFAGVDAKQPQALELITPSVILQQVPFSATIQLQELKNGSVYPRFLSYRVTDANGVILQNGTFETLDAAGNYNSKFAQVAKKLQFPTYGSHEITTTVHEVPANVNATGSTSASEATVGLFSVSVSTTVYVTPGWLSLLPPIVTLVMSALLSQVLIALLAGIWCGATIVAQGNAFVGFLRTFDQYWVNAFVDDGHAGVLLFTIVLGGTIGVVQKGGGGHGLALLAKEYMTTSLRMQLSTWLLCLLIFFDDYSCILIIGNSLRQVLSQTGVSREKFAAIIHVIGVCLPPWRL
jgi:hypothetical protein